MGTINVHVQAAVTVTPINGVAFDAILLWVKQNITDKVPNGTTVTVDYHITP